MAKRVVQRTYGVDVAKAWLDIFSPDSGELERIDNDTESIENWLRGLCGVARLSVEATNSFHELFIARAHANGHHVYVVDAFKLSRYRDAVGHRAKTDRRDAALLARYVLQEHQQLRRWEPLDPRQTRLWRLLKRRAVLVQTTTRLRQSLTDLGSLDAAAVDLIKHCQ
ncbi:MAG: IS110 family transposase, partial [Gammaproteobacteria bacterium]|nr:IS110 family transposase [Gammaproteobacteria bacterium]